MSTLTLPPVLTMTGPTVTGPARRTSGPSIWRLVRLESPGAHRHRVEIDADDQAAITLLTEAGAHQHDPYRWDIRPNQLTEFLNHGFALHVTAEAEDEAESMLASAAATLRDDLDTFTAAIDLRDLHASRDLARRTPLPGTYEWASDPEVHRGIVFVQVRTRPRTRPTATPGDPGWCQHFSSTTLVSVLGTPGLTHRVSWINGRLVFHDHPDGIDNPETLAFEALAGERSCGCRLLRDWWRSQDGKISYLGPSIMIEDDRFRAAHQLRQQVTANRERARQNETVDRWSQQLLTRTVERTLHAATRAVRFTSYRCRDRLRFPRDPHRTTGDRDIPVQIDITNDSPPTVECNGAGGTLLFRVRPTWWAQQVDTVGGLVGVLICDVLARDDGLPTRVVAGRPGPGLTVYPCQATITWDHSSPYPKPTLRWERRNEPQR